MDRAKAKSMTRTVQTVAMAMVAIAAAAALVPLSVKADAVATGPTTPAAPSKQAEAPKVELDVTSAAMFLNSVSGPVKNQPIDPGIVDPPAAPVLTGVDSWRYLGGIISSSYKRAVVVIDDQQHLFAEGQKYNPDAAHNPDGGVEIVQIDRAFVKVKKEDGTEQTLGIAPRQKPVLTVIDPATAGRGGNMPVTANYTNPGALRGGAAAALGSTMGDANANRLRSLDRQRADAKARGDNAAVMGLDAAINDASKEGKSEKGEKGQK